jgi:glutamate-1-semialdehyde 2,1-aminomutase
MLVKAGSGVATFALPDSPGVPAAVAASTLVARYNDIRNVERLFEEYADDLAAVIVEPVCGNMGVIVPDTGFLERLRALTRETGALLIFDEVITGFRLSPGGAQELYALQPDLSCLGKVIGGGLPLAAFGGRSDIMNLLAPEGPVYQAGTLSGNPLAVAAGKVTLEILARAGVYEKLEQRAKALESGLAEALKSYGIPGVVNRVGSMLTLFFGVARVHDADQARQCDKNFFARFFHAMIGKGVYWPPSPYEAAFVSLAHEWRDIEDAVHAFADWASRARVV